MLAMEDGSDNPDLEENHMHKRAAGFILTGVLATGAAGAVAVTPASATTSDNVVTSRLAKIKSALSGLISDGTLTKAQADKVAKALDSKLPKGHMDDPRHMAGKAGKAGKHGMGGHFGWMGLEPTRAAAAKALGMTTAQLQTALEGGKSLAALAKDKKVSVTTLVKAMVAATEAELAKAVKAGIMTQAQANTMKSSLTKRITDRVNDVRGERGRGHDARGEEMSPPAGSTSGATPAAPSAFV